MRTRETSITLALMLLVLAVALHFVFPPKANILPQGFSDPIIAFEFANTEQEISDLFSFEAKAQHDKFIADMLFGNFFDYAYMIFYSLFLASIIWHNSQIKKIKFIYAFYGLVFIIFLGDAFENVFLLKIINAIRLEKEFAAFIPWLHTITWMKWEGLAIVFALFNFVIQPTRKWLKVANYWFLLPLLLSVASWIQKPVITDYFVKTIILSFLLAFINVLVKPRKVITT
jgi:hypothetical protein